VKVNVPSFYLRCAKQIRAPRIADPCLDCSRLGSSAHGMSTSSRTLCSHSLQMRHALLIAVQGLTAGVDIKDRAWRRYSRHMSYHLRWWRLVVIGIFGGFLIALAFVYWWVHSADPPHVLPANDTQAKEMLSNYQALNSATADDVRSVTSTLLGIYVLPSFTLLLGYLFGLHQGASPREG
jgi:hypothetical protein